LKRLFPLLGLFLFFSLPAYASKSFGWKEVRGHYQPFVVVQNPSKKIVLFITPEGKVYEGNCKEGKGKGACRFIPSKEFSEKVPIRFIVLDLSHSVPSVVKTGIIR